MREERRSRRAAGTLAVIAGLAAGTIASSLGALTGDRESGLRMTVPAGGAAGPQQAWVLDRPHVAELGAHRFGRTRPPEAVVARAAWGRGAGALGLRAGREQATVGPSSFDVGSHGSVRILDQVNHRLAIYRPGTATRPARVVPLAISGAMADLVTGAGGTVYVLDQGRHGQMAVRAFGRSGRQLGSSSLPGAVVADQLRTGPNGPVVHQYPDETWLPATPPGGRSPRAAQPAASARAGRPVTIPPGADPSARPTAEAGAVVIRALPHEARVALVGGTRVLAAWRRARGGRPRVDRDAGRAAGSPARTERRGVRLRRGPGRVGAGAAVEPLSPQR